MEIIFLLKNNVSCCPSKCLRKSHWDPSLYIGGREFSSDGPFEGVIDDLRIYDQYLLHRRGMKFLILMILRLLHILGGF